MSAADPHADLRERLIELRDYLRRGEQSEFLGAEDFDILAEAVNALTPEQQDTGRELRVQAAAEYLVQRRRELEARAEAAEAVIERVRSWAEGYPPYALLSSSDWQNWELTKNAVLSLLSDSNDQEADR